MRIHAGLAALFVLIASARIIATYQVFNHTIDEPAHLAAGMEWIDDRQYTLEDLHPPLARVCGAIGPHLIGVHRTGDPNIWYEGFRLLGRGEHYDRALALGRAGILPFFWLASAVVFLWTLRIAGPLPATIGTFVFTTIPPVLAHAGLITTDMAATASIGAALLASLYWCEKPNLPRTLVLGLSLALALLSKFSALPFLVCAWPAMYLIALLKNRPGFRQTLRDIRARILPACGALSVAALGVWAGYLFTFGNVEYLGLRLPAPAFFTGLRSAYLRVDHPGPAYILGERSLEGFWYFFPVILSFKTPLALLVLLIAAIWLTIRLRDRLNLAIPLASAFAILLFSMTSHLNLGTRYVLPVYIGFSIASGVAAAYLIRNRRHWTRAFGCSLLAWQLLSGALHHPNHLAYANELAGPHPENILVDSDLDWGQDMKRLGERLEELGAKEVTMNIFNRGYLFAGDPFPAIKEMPAGDTPAPGWNAVSLTAWKMNAFPRWPNHIPPREVIGRSIFLYYFPISAQTVPAKPAVPVP